MLHNNNNDHNNHNNNDNNKQTLLTTLKQTISRTEHKRIKESTTPNHQYVNKKAVAINTQLTNTTGQQQQQQLQ